MKNVPAHGQVTPGYDVSHYQPNLAIHDQMKAAGKKFCLIKADEGTKIVDSMFKKHYAAAKAAGMKVGFYNFFHPSQDSHMQAKHILGLIGGMNNDLGAVCDLETADRLGAPIVSGAAFQYLTDIKKAMGQAILYGGPYFLRDTAKIDARFKDFPLWVAHYGPAMSKGPLVPEPYTDWTIWQYTEANGLDLNFFNGDEAALDKFCLHTIAKT